MIDPKQISQRERERMRESEQFWCCVKHSRQSQPQRSTKDGLMVIKQHHCMEGKRKREMEKINEEKKTKERAKESTKR